MITDEQLEVLSDESKTHYDQILNYSKCMTKYLFGSQIWTPAITSRQTKLTTRDSSDLNETTKAIKAIELNKQNDSSKSVVISHKGQSASKTNPGILALPTQHNPLVRDNSDNTLKVGTLEIAKLPNPSLAISEQPHPEWHPPWKLYRVICGNGGWVHSLAVDPANMWFASGCRDGLIKIWDIASGRLRITLTGHISGVRGLAVSDRHPYLFSCGDDKMVKCWDLERNQVVRHYHGHLSGVYCLSLHPTENVLITGGRDSVARVWDMRTKEQIFCLTGHTNTVGSLLCQEKNPQLITGSYDTTMRLWDLRNGKKLHTLTHHKKSVRALAFKHDRSSFASGATDNIKQWTLPEAEFVQNLRGHDSIVNALATNDCNILASGADNGMIFFWDWRTGYKFQQLYSPPQRGSIESEAGILAMTFDRSGARLITGESDKTIKMFREDQNATEDTHPIDWKPELIKRSHF